MEKTCIRCKKKFPCTVEFWGTKQAGRGRGGKVFPSSTKSYLHSWCRGCQRHHARERQAARRKDPAERAKLLAEKRKYAQSPKGKLRKRLQSFISNNKRRQKLFALPFQWTEADWIRCKEMWASRCAYCNKATDDLTQDHFIPIADPLCPGTVPWNMLPACMSCNASKQACPPKKWVKSPQRLALIVDRLVSLTPPASLPSSS